MFSLSSKWNWEKLLTEYLEENGGEEVDIAHALPQGVQVYPKVSPATTPLLLNISAEEMGATVFLHLSVARGAVVSFRD